jgi:hypothetical protein
MAVRRTLISRRELEEADDYCEKAKLLSARLQDRLKEGMKAKQPMLDADIAKAKIKAVKEIMERKEA